MKKISVLLILFLCIIGCNSINNSKVEVDIINTKNYSVTEINEARDIVLKKVSNFKDSKIIEFSYDGESDAIWRKQYDNKQIIVLNSIMRTGSNPDKTMNSNTDYPWQWVLIRKNSKDKWKLVSYGF